MSLGYSWLGPWLYWCIVKCKCAINILKGYIFITWFKDSLKISISLYVLCPMKLYLSMVKKEGIIEFKKKKNQNEISLPKSKQSLPQVGLLNLSLMISLCDNALCSPHQSISLIVSHAFGTKKSWSVWEYVRLCKQRARSGCCVEPHLWETFSHVFFHQIIHTTINYNKKQLQPYNIDAYL